jgi:hypothetical protein
MDDHPDPTMLHCTLWHVPSGTLPLTSNVRGEAMQFVATLLGEGMPPGHLRLQCTCVSERSLTHHAGVRVAALPHKWQ